MARNRKNGFTLIEILLVIAMIGILSGIAIPSYMGQRKRARMIGDAQTNAQVLAMALETQRADSGLYGASGAYTWWASASPASSSKEAKLLPGFTPKGNTKMNYVVTIGPTGLTYLIDVHDPAGQKAVLGTMVLQKDQTGAVLKKVE